MFKYCCDEMKSQLEFKCEEHSDKFDCPDVLILKLDSKLQKRAEYGLIIHDGGSSFKKISFCPWCGKELAKRD